MADGLSTLQRAAAAGSTEQVASLLAGGARATPRRGPKSPYRLAMRRGHIATLVALRRAGVASPPGSQPPAVLPGAVVLRNYLPLVANVVAVAGAVLGIVLTIVVRHWAMLLVAAGAPAMVVAGNAVIGRTRIAVDGPMLAVRQLARWQGPIDVRELVAIGYAPALSARMSARWRFVQRQAGPPYRRSAYQGFEVVLADTLKRQHDLRVVTLYCGRGFLSPGIERHLAPYVLSSSALVSSEARSALVTGVVECRPLR